MITEVVTDAHDGSEFRTVTLEYRTDQFAPPAPAFDISEPTPAESVRFIQLPDGWVGGWHNPPADGYVVVLSGTIELETTDGRTRRFCAGDVWRHRDLVGRGHNTRVVSDATVRLMVTNLKV